MNIGFVSTRFAGTDGVSLEAQKWADTLEALGHQPFWFSGLNDRPDAISYVVPEAFFEHPAIRAINESVWGLDSIPEDTQNSIDALTGILKEELRTFCAERSIDLLIPQNSLTIPMNLPLGLAITKFIKETNIPTVAHHHDFFWERERFTGKAAGSILKKAFPPDLPSITHAVINSEAGRQLHQRLGLDSVLIPNVMDFDAPPITSSSAPSVKSALGFAPDDILFLQPTRVVPRKGIEHAIELVARLEDPSIKLVISHKSGDEGHDYLNTLVELADSRNVDLRLIGEKIHASQGDGKTSHYSLDELYPISDFITYPSLYEGFGNALLETVYFRKPALVNRFPVYVDDIEPVGFDFVTMDGEITEQTVSAVRDLLSNPTRIQKAVEHNFELGRQHFGLHRITTPLAPLLEAL